MEENDVQSSNIVEKGRKEARGECNGFKTCCALQELASRETRETVDERKLCD
jgi:hypothetical protein